MAGAKLEQTRWPGIYRRGSRWAYDWTDASGKRRRGTAGSREEASKRKAEEEQRAVTGQVACGPAERLTVASYALDLLGADLDRAAGADPVPGRYQGRRGAVRASTSDSYRRHLELYWLPAIGRRSLSGVNAPDLLRVVAALAARDDDEYLTDASLRRIFAPMGALLATAVEEGLIPHNPARDVRLPSGRDELRRFDPDAADDSDDPSPGRARALTQEQLETLLEVVDARWRTLFALLAATGLRISEALALRWRDLRLDGDRPAVIVRRAYVDGTFGPPKSRHGRREVPLSFDQVRTLRARRSAAEWHEGEDLVFTSTAGTPMDARNLRRRTLSPAAGEAGASWAGSPTRACRRGRSGAGRLSVRRRARIRLAARAGVASPIRATRRAMALLARARSRVGAVR
jgi:integrase